MRVNKRYVGIIVLGAILLGLAVLAFHWPPQPKVTVRLADGSSFVLVGTDSGQQLCYGGGRLQTLLCKAFRHPLPTFVRNQPAIWPSNYTNGIALYFRREEPGRQALQSAWNGTGQLYFLDDSGAERPLSNHAVRFGTEKRAQTETVVEENMHWELPMMQDPELRLRIRETNSLTGSVSTHDFQIKNPVM